MVKNFDEFINERNIIKRDLISAEDSPECLLKIADYLNSYKLNVNKEHVDGRIGSIKDEDSCIEALGKSDEFITVKEDDFDGAEFDDKIYIVEPKIRNWYDILVVYNKKNYYINIKSSTLQSADNVGSVDTIMFGLFGKKIKSNDKDKKYAELFHEYNMRSDIGFDDIEGIDYYFLVVDKNNNGNCFITSISHMNKKSIKSNGSNPPFQCEWTKNSNKKNNKKDICNWIIEAIFNSLIKTVSIFNTEPLKVYIDRHKKKVSIPLWED